MLNLELSESISPFRFQIDHAQGRQGQFHVERLVLPGKLESLAARNVGHATAAEFHVVRIQNLLIEACLRHAHPIALARQRREVTHYDQVVTGGFPFSHESDYGIIGIAKIDPFEPLGFKVDLVE